MLDIKLVNTANQMEADILTELLKQEGIVSLQKAVGSGGYMQIATGMNIFGVDIYVSADDYDKAKEISDGFYSNSNEGADIENEEA